MPPLLHEICHALLSGLWSFFVCPPPTLITPPPHTPAGMDVINTTLAAPVTVFAPSSLLVFESREEVALPEYFNVTYTCLA